MQPRPITGEERDAARTLLLAAQLPVDDLDDPSIALSGAFEHGLLGVVGLQRCGQVGLLRSLAVAPAARERGIARALCEHVIAAAQRDALEALWLLTTTAKDYFVRHGFVAVPRDDVPAAIQRTSQFSSLCPASAVAMRRSLYAAATRAR